MIDLPAKSARNPAAAIGRRRPITTVGTLAHFYAKDVQIRALRTKLYSQPKYQAEGAPESERNKLIGLWTFSSFNVRPLNLSCEHSFVPSCSHLPLVSVPRIVRPHQCNIYQLAQFATLVLFPTHERRTSVPVSLGLARTVHPAKNRAHRS